MIFDEKFKSWKFLLDRGMYFCILITARYIDFNLEWTLKGMSNKHLFNYHSSNKGSRLE